MRSGQAGFMSRRGFLATGAASGILAVSAGALALKLTRPEDVYRGIAGPGPAPLVLNWKGLAVLTQVAGRVIQPGAGMPDLHDTMTARRIDLELSYGSEKLQSDMKASLGYLEVLPALSGDIRPFSSLAGGEQDAILRSMRAKPGTDRSIYMALKFFAGLFYYSDDRSWPSVGYAGPGMPEKRFEAGNRISNLIENRPGGAR